MAFNRPIPETNKQPSNPGGMRSLVEAEKLMQIAFLLPSAVLVGWGIGALAENHWHQKWMLAVGLMLGCVAGLVSVIRLAFATERATSKGENGGGKGKRHRAMTEQTHPIVEMKQADLDALLSRALKKTLLAGLALALVLGIAGGWRNGAMAVAGAAVSAASILEWQRLARVMNARMDNQRTPAGAWSTGLIFVLRLTIFAGVIYGSLKCFRGSPIALLCGLALAVLTLGWETIRLLRD